MATSFARCGRDCAIAGGYYLRSDCAGLQRRVGPLTAPSCPARSDSQAGQRAIRGEGARSSMPPPSSISSSQSASSDHAIVAWTFGRPCLAFLEYIKALAKSDKLDSNSRFQSPVTVSAPGPPTQTALFHPSVAARQNANMAENTNPDVEKKSLILNAFVMMCSSTPYMIYHNTHQ